MKGSLHYTFSDFLTVAETLGLRLNSTQRFNLVGTSSIEQGNEAELVDLLSGYDVPDPAAVIEAIAEGFLPTRRSREIIVSYTVAFLESVLKGREVGILEGPSRKFADVIFV